MKKAALPLLLAGLCMLIRAQGQQLPAVSLSGVVVESGTNMPLARVSLELRPATTQINTQLPPSAPQSAQRYPGLTGENGQFVFRNIPPGRYALLASRNGYVHAEYGQRGPNGKGLLLTVEAGRPLTNVELSMVKTAAVSGHVIDSTGAPFAYMQMHARRITYPEGQRTLTITASTYTDDLGEYRLYGLPPGQYLISAEGETPSQGILPVAATLAPPLPGSIVIQGIGGSMAYAADPANQRKPAQRAGAPRAPTYFQNTTFDRDAWVFQLAPGDDLKAIDITATTIAMVPVTISGPASAVSVQLTITPGGTPIRISFQRGSFTAQLAPGSYVVAATGTDSAQKMVMGYLNIDVNPANLPRPVLALDPPLAVTGKVVTDGATGTTPIDTRQVRLRFRRVPAIPGIPNPTAMPATDGTFSTVGFVEGDYAVEAPSLPAGTFLKSVRQRGAELPNMTFHAPPDAATDFEISLARGAAQLEGSAVASAGGPLSNVVVALIPDNRGRGDLFKTVTTDATGRFKLEGCAPGDYKLFSWEDVEPDAWLNPDFMRKIEDLGKPVRIAEGGRVTMDAAVIPMR
jgi:Carboxypeptidase regulatory-like domain